MTKKQVQDQIVKDMAGKIADETALASRRDALVEIVKAVAEHKPEGEALDLIKCIAASVMMEQALATGSK